MDIVNMKGVFWKKKSLQIRMNLYTFMYSKTLINKYLINL